MLLASPLRMTSAISSSHAALPSQAAGRRTERYRNGAAPLPRYFDSTRPPARALQEDLFDITIPSRATGVTFQLQTFNRTTNQPPEKTRPRAEETRPPTVTSASVVHDGRQTSKAIHV